MKKIENDDDVGESLLRHLNDLGASLSASPRNQEHRVIQAIHSLAFSLGLSAWEAREARKMGAAGIDRAFAKIEKKEVSGG